MQNLIQNYLLLSKSKSFWNKFPTVLTKVDSYIEYVHFYRQLSLELSFFNSREACKKSFKTFRKNKWEK